MPRINARIESLAKQLQSLNSQEVEELLIKLVDPEALGHAIEEEENDEPGYRELGENVITWLGGVISGELVLDEMEEEEEDDEYNEEEIKEMQKQADEDLEKDTDTYPQEER